MDRPIDPGEGAGPDLVEQLGVAEVITPPLSLEQPLELKARQQFPPHQRLTEGLGRRGVTGFGDAHRPTARAGTSSSSPTSVGQIVGGGGLHGG